MQKSYYPKNKIGVRKEVYKTIESSSNSFLSVFFIRSKIKMHPYDPLFRRKGR